MKKETLSWALYDFGNSAFATTVMAGFFPLFFKEYYASGLDATTSTAHLGFANAFASLLIVLFAPLLGAISDSLGYKKRFLFLFTFLAVLMTFSLSFANQGDWEIAVFLYIMGVIGFSGSMIFYDALLPFVSSKEKRNFVSGLGFSLGYLGGGVLFTINVLMYQFPESFFIANQEEAIKLSFISVALWWAIFSIPVFLFVKEPEIEKKGSVLDGYKRLITTLKKIKYLKTIFLFLLAYWFYIDGVDTIVRMAVDYGLAVGFDAKDLILGLLMIQFIGFPATLLFAKLGEVWDTKKAIMLAIFVYFIIITWAVFMEHKYEFYCIAALIGIVQGGIQALSRAYYSKMIPKENMGEFFGFYNMIGKFAAVIGPILIASTALISEDSRVSIASVIILFIIGGYLLSKVDESKAKDEFKALGYK